MLGGILLKLPIATTKSISWVDAFFTATSAATVTGLGVVDTGTTFTIFGQVVIMLLIQTGGLGFMTLAILIVMILGKRIGLR
jgi:trk system potassium uptake protein TrkH